MYDTSYCVTHCSYNQTTTLSTLTRTYFSVSRRVRYTGPGDPSPIGTKTMRSPNVQSKVSAPSQSAPTRAPAPVPAPNPVLSPSTASHGTQSPSSRSTVSDRTESVRSRGDDRENRHTVTGREEDLSSTLSSGHSNKVCTVCTPNMSYSDTVRNHCFLFRLYLITF